MKSETYPLALPSELLREARKTADETGLSLADAVCQGLKLGLPQLRGQLPPQAGLKPFTPEESRAAFGSDPEWDRTTATMARLSIARIEDE